MESLYVETRVGDDARYVLVNPIDNNQSPRHKELGPQSIIIIIPVQNAAMVPGTWYEKGKSEWHVDMERRTGGQRVSDPRFCSNRLLGIRGDPRFCSNRLLGIRGCLLYTSPSPRDRQKSRMPSSA